MAKHSAGVLLFRGSPGALGVMLVHAGGRAARFRSGFPAQRDRRRFVRGRKHTPSL
jgi:predicted NUDIX family NTP pyrophosphohydrolase